MQQIFHTVSAVGSGRVLAASDGLGAARGWTEPAKLNL